MSLPRYPTSTAGEIEPHQSSTPILSHLDESREPPCSPRPKAFPFKKRKASSRHKRQHQTTYPPPPPPSQQKHKHTYTHAHSQSQNPPYAQTTHTHLSLRSNYQQDSTIDLPSASKWPSQDSIAERGRIEDDLLGLDLLQPDLCPYSMTMRIPDKEWVMSVDENETFVGKGNGYGRTSRDGGVIEAVFGWNQDRCLHGYGFVNNIEDGLWRL